MTVGGTRKEYLLIHDRCRQGFLKYLAEAFEFVLPEENPEILDVGCGTGVPTIWVAEHTGGRIVAVDTDQEAIEWLAAKCEEKGLSDRITTVYSSFARHDFGEKRFDIIVAEGFLNVVGFSKGFRKMNSLLREGGFMVIHDDSADRDAKIDFITSQGCTVVMSSMLDEKIWWNNYYRQLEDEISSPGNIDLARHFGGDISEIEQYRKDPLRFRSVYYVVRKETDQKTAHADN